MAGPPGPAAWAGPRGLAATFCLRFTHKISRIRPFGLTFCLRPAGTLSFFVFTVSFRFNSFLPFDAIGMPAQNQPPVGWDPFRFSFLPFYFVLFRLFSFIFVFFVFTNGSDRLGGPPLIRGCARGGLVAAPVAGWWLRPGRGVRCCACS